MSGLDEELGKVRDLTNTWLLGGPTAANAVRDLFQLLLGATILADGEYVRLTSTPGSQTEWVLGSAGGPLQPLQLRDKRWLSLRASMYLDQKDSRGRLLKVKQSSYQYQEDQAGKDWICRYDYLREARDAHPTGHLQINGNLKVAGVLEPTYPLKQDPLSHRSRRP